jgi:AcrR family transcriptional regulator
LAEALRQARPARGRASAGGWQWSRTAETQRALLDAAREVFIEQGFTSASVTDIVERAGSSVGSKSEMFLALWHEYKDAQEDASGKAIAQAQRAGVTDPLALFTAGAKAYLEGCWQRRELAELFRTGDAPPNFSSLMRADGCQWICQVDSLQTLTGKSSDRLYMTILTSLMREGAHEVATAKNRRQATKVINAVLEYARRLMADGPWQQPATAAVPVP